MHAKDNVSTWEHTTIRKVAPMPPTAAEWHTNACKDAGVTGTGHINRLTWLLKSHSAHFGLALILSCGCLAASNGSMEHMLIF
eukprot:605438-Pelagomonas_calceolata.AAC.1